MSGTRFWQALTGPERDALSECGWPRVFPAGTTLCVEGEPATHLFVVTSGWVKVLSVTRDGQERLRALRGNGDVVGELADVTEGRRTATMRAIGRVTTLIVPHDAFEPFLADHPNAGHAFRETVTRRWGEAASMLLAATTTTGKQRLARLLLDLAAQHGQAEGAAIVIEMPLSQDELAGLASTSRPTLARAFRQWRDRGFIRTGRHHITIISPEGLRKAADVLYLAIPDTTDKVTPGTRIHRYYNTSWGVRVSDQYRGLGCPHFYAIGGVAGSALAER